MNDTADQISRIQSDFLQNVDRQRGDGCFAVRACDRDGMRKECSEMRECLAPFHAEDSAFVCFREFRIIRCSGGCMDDEEVRSVSFRQIFRGVSLMKDETLFLEGIGQFGRDHIRSGAGKSEFETDGSQGACSGSGASDEMEFSSVFFEVSEIEWHFFIRFFRMKYRIKRAEIKKREEKKGKMILLLQKMCYIVR